MTFIRVSYVSGAIVLLSRIVPRWRISERFVHPMQQPAICIVILVSNESFVMWTRSNIHEDALIATSQYCTRKDSSTVSTVYVIRNLFGSHPYSVRYFDGVYGFIIFRLYGNIVHMWALCVVSKLKYAWCTWSADWIAHLMVWKVRDRAQV